jgi:hypothetical protein
MEHPRRTTIDAVGLTNSLFGSEVVGEYWWHRSWPIAVREGDYCRLDWYDAKQPHLF